MDLGRSGDAVTAGTPLVTKRDTRRTNLELDEIDQLTKRQWELEAEMVDAGAERFRARLAKAAERGEAATAGAAQRFVMASVQSVAAAVRALVAHAASGAPGRRHIAVSKLAQVDPEVAAFIAIS